MKALSTSHWLLTYHSKWRYWCIVLATTLVFCSNQVLAQFPRIESFRNATASGWTIGGDASLTGNNTTDPAGQGYLRLTPNDFYQAGYAIDNSAFPATQGFSISFEFFAYGGSATGETGADGFSVFLIDGSTSAFAIGGDGGSLGYAQRNSAPGVTTPGVTNGYIGIGIDEYGNYSNSTEGRSGGLVATGLTPDAVAIRGAGNGTGAGQYPYLTGTGSLPFSLDVATDRAQNGSGDYRRAFIDVIATGGSYRITVRIQHGTSVTTTVSSFVVPAPPSTLRIGFSGSTGASRNVHEIRNLQIVLPPVAANDQAATLLDTNVSFDVVSNDQAPGSSIDAASVDLDPNASGTQNTFTVAGEGTFTVNSSGVVTFDPLPTFAGVVRIPYRVNSILNSSSNLANLTVRVATSCATPGKDGPGTLAPTTIANTYYPGTASAAAGSSTVAVGPAGAGATPISAGDLVLIMQMQGATISTANDLSYGANNNTGTGNSTTDFTAGQYEYGIAATDLPLAGGTLQLASSLQRSYQNLSYSDPSNPTGQRRFQVIRVPQYSSLSVSGTSTGTPAWNGTTGGVLALDVAGLTSFTAGSVIDLTGKGFRGGGGRVNSGNPTTATNTDFRRGDTSVHGAKGEGTAGTPQYVYNGAGIVNNGVLGYLNGFTSRGAPGNAGGGATDFVPATNSGNAGGAGGGNGGRGGLGGFGFSSGGTGAQALGGAVLPLSGTTRLVLGGGGGAGSANGSGGSNANFAAASGGVGGGILLLRTGSVSGTGTLRASGSNAPGVGAATEGAGGGGAGGSIVVLANLTTGLSGLTMQATGGNGGSASTATTNATTDAYGPGGGGGGGFIYTNGSAPVSVAGGSAGTTTTSSVAFGATAGEAGLASTAASRSIPYTIAGAGGCLPELNTALATSTPTLTRSGGEGSSVAPATYTLTVSNTGGGAATGVASQVSLPAGLFGYDATGPTTITVRLADNTTYTPTGVTLPASGSSTPTFGNIFLPTDATLLITFRVTVAASALDEVFYQASATTTYADPTRDQTTDVVSPGGTYTAGGPVEGANYASASNTAEDVRIARPLPVELVFFEAKASGPDAELTWVTASEKNNARFEVERSLDGTSFQRTASVAGQGTTTRRTTYRHLDTGAGKLGLPVVYYRLRQVDTDGTSSLSPVRIASFRPGKGVVSVYPNPAPAHATLDLSGLPAGQYQGEILDLTGRPMRAFLLQGASQEPLQLLHLPAGSYLLRVTGPSTSLVLPLVHKE